MEAPEEEVRQEKPIFTVLAWLAAPNLVYLVVAFVPKEAVSTAVAVALFSPIVCGAIGGILWTRGLQLKGAKRFVAGVFVCLAMIAASFVMGIPGCGISSAFYKV